MFEIILWIVGVVVVAWGAATIAERLSGVTPDSLYEDGLSEEDMVFPDEAIDDEEDAPIFQ